MAFDGFNNRFNLQEKVVVSSALNRTKTLLNPYLYKRRLELK